MSDDPTTIYRAALLEYARDERHRGPLEGAQLRGRALNPLCGDELVIRAIVDADGAVKQLRFEVRGCAIASASAHLLGELAPGHTPEQLERHGEALRAALEEGEPLPPELERLAALLVLRSRRSRHACALLPWQAVGAFEALARFSTAALDIDPDGPVSS